MKYEDCLGGSSCSIRQKCPSCSLVEAHGAYCTRCGTKTPPEAWFKAEPSEARKAALAKARTARSGQRNNRAEPGAGS